MRAAVGVHPGAAETLVDEFYLIAAECVRISSLIRLEIHMQINSAVGSRLIQFMVRTFLFY